MKKSKDSHSANDSTADEFVEGEQPCPESGGESADGNDDDSPLAQLEADLQSERDQKLRLAADMENLRKRMQREREELQRYATLSLLEDLLGPLDNFQIGLKAADQHPEAKAVADGFRMAYQQLRQALEQHGLTAISPGGEVFDPNLHECVAHQANAEVAEDHVISVLRTGYSFRDRLIRPASVIVSSGPGGEPSSDDANDRGAS